MLQRRTWQHDVMPLQQVSAGLKPLTSSGLRHQERCLAGKGAGCNADRPTVRHAGLADIYETKIGSDASSHSDLLIGTSFTLTGAHSDCSRLWRAFHVGWQRDPAQYSHYLCYVGVSKHAVAQLSGSAGQQLQAAIKVVGTEFELATAGMTSV